MQKWVSLKKTASAKRWEIPCEYMALVAATAVRIFERHIEVSDPPAPADLEAQAKQTLTQPRPTPYGTTMHEQKIQTSSEPNG